MGLGAGLSVCLTNGESGNLVLYHKIIQTHNLILSVYMVCAVFMKVKLKLFRNFFGLATDYNAKSIKKKYFCLTQYKCLKNLVAFFTFIAYFTFNHQVPPKQRLFKLLWFTRANLTAFIFCVLRLWIYYTSLLCVIDTCMYWTSLYVEQQRPVMAPISALFSISKASTRSATTQQWKHMGCVWSKVLTYCIPIFICNRMKNGTENFSSSCCVTCLRQDTTGE